MPTHELGAGLNSDGGGFGLMQEEADEYWYGSAETREGMRHARAQVRFESEPRAPRHLPPPAGRSLRRRCRCSRRRCCYRR